MRATALLLLLVITGFCSTVFASTPPSSVFDRDLMSDLLAVPTEMDGPGASAPAPTEQRASEERQVLYPLVTPDCPQLLTVRVDDDDVVWQGDIVLGPRSELQIYDAGPTAPLRDVTDVPAARATANRILVAGYTTGLVNDDYYLWPHGIIPYTIDEALKPMMPRILRAIAAWNEKTNVNMVHAELEKDFIRRNGGSQHWRVHFVASTKDYSASYVGRREVQHVDAPRRAQPIWLQQNASYRTILHEIGHTIGLLHEHQRPDRDRFIQIVQANVQENKWDQFAVERGGHTVGEYDVYSIMHYSPDIFTRGSEPTFNVQAGLSRSELHLVGAASTITQGDVAAVAAMYPTKVYHIGDYEVPSVDMPANDVPSVTPLTPVTREDAFMPSENEMRRLALDELPSGHPRRLSDIVAVVAENRSMGGLQVVEATVTFADPSRPSDRVTYVYGIHNGSSGPYVMYVKRR